MIELLFIIVYNYTSNFIGGHGCASDHQMHSGQALVLFDVFGFILSNLLVNSRYALGRALVRARSYSQITGPPQKLHNNSWGTFQDQYNDKAVFWELKKN